MYESFFNLTTKPFDLLPNPEFLFLSRSHKKAATYLDYAVRERAGFILLTGEIGSGKTTIIRDLIKKHHKSIVLSKIFNTRVSSEQLIAMINEDFGLAGTGADKTILLRDLNEFLIDQYGKGNKPVLIIDEAQNLASETLEEVRMLSNLETDSAKLLQIILVGQPELVQTLALPGLLQLRQRISFSCHLQPLSLEETGEYILHRLEVAGNREALVFSREATGTIWTHSRGIPRLINMICDFLLLSAFAEGTREISAGLAEEIIGELDFENRIWGECGLSVGQEERAVPAGGAIKGEASGDGEIMALLAEIIRRIDNVEKRDSFPALKGLEGIDHRLAQYDQTVRDHRETTARELEELRKELQAMKSTDVPDSSSRKGEGERKKGFLRNLFRAD